MTLNAAVKSQLKYQILGFLFVPIHSIRNYKISRKIQEWLKIFPNKRFPSKETFWYKNTKHIMTLYFFQHFFVLLLKGSKNGKTKVIVSLHAQTICFAFLYCQTTSVSLCRENREISLHLELIHEINFIKKCQSNLKFKY